MRNGNPVCPEKKRSFPDVIKLRRGDSSASFDGYGPIWVSETKIALIMINSETAFIRNGAVFLNLKQSATTKRDSIIAPCTKINSKSKTGVLLKIISST
jgi:hypothetical protein